MTIHLSQLGTMREYGYSITAFCETCGHFAKVDLDKLVDRFGPTFDTVDNRAELLRALKCSKCQGRKMDVRLHGPTGFDGR